MALEQRDKNRLREHSLPGHSLVRKEERFFTNGSKIGGEKDEFSCSCGWVGWLSPEVLLPSEEGNL